MKRRKEPKEELKLYHEPTKERFLDSLKNKDTTVESYKKYLKTMGRYEWKVDKDLYDLTLDEILDMFSSLQTSSNDTLAVMLTTLKNYRRWAMSERLMSSNIDDALVLTNADIKQFVSKTKYKNKYFKNIEQLKNLVDFCINFQDKAMFILPYYGIDGTAHEELRNLKISDCDFENCTVKVNRNGKIVTINIPFEFMQYIKVASKEYEYRQKNGVMDVHKRRISDLCSNEYVLRPAQLSLRIANKRIGNISEKDFKISSQIINQRMKSIAEIYSQQKDLMENREKLNPQNIMWSGIFHTLYNKEQEKELTQQDIEDICEQYNLNKDINNVCDIRNKYETFKYILL